MDRLTVLKGYVRLVELGTFTRAAEDLRVKQSTISKWIAALEDELGVRLLDRTTRSVRVTDAGQRFARQASAILADYETAVADARESSHALRGRIRANLPVVFGARFLVPLVSEFLTRHADLEIELSFGDRYVSLVEEGFDLVVRIGVPIDSSLQSHALAESARRVVASPTYLEQFGEPRTPKELEHHQCLIHTELSSRAAWSFRRGKQRYVANVVGRVSANHSDSTLHFARSGLGIALLADWLVDADLERGELVALLTDYDPPTAPIRALTPPGRRVPPRVRALIEWVRAGLPDALSR